ncbi:MAG: pyrroline-5-carboxylate reductase [Campylobacterales bacterium]
MKLLLIGAGNMGGALLRGWSGKHEIKVMENSPRQREQLQKSVGPIAFAEPDEPCEGYCVVLAVKPQSIGSVTLKGEADAIVSIVAGVALKTLKERFEAKHYVRAMPNLAALHGASATALTGDEHFKNEALELLGAVGTACWLQSEKELDIATALAGSGPGYLALVAESMANAAVMLGMRNDDAHTLTQALFAGMGPLLKHDHPALLKEKVASPGGTTAAGLAALEAQGARNAFYQALSAAYERSLALSKS